MANVLGLASQGAYRNYENGDAFPQVEKLVDIVDFFNGSVRFLIGES